jgi:hypothetical protein
VAGNLAALGDSLPGSLTRVTGVVRAGVRTGRRPARGSLKFGALRGRSRGSSEQVVKCPMPVARQILLQIAARDIGQLT